MTSDQQSRWSVGGSGGRKGGKGSSAPGTAVTLKRALINQCFHLIFSTSKKKKKSHLLVDESSYNTSPLRVAASSSRRTCIVCMSLLPSHQPSTFQSSSFVPPPAAVRPFHPQNQTLVNGGGGRRGWREGAGRSTRQREISRDLLGGRASGIKVAFFAFRCARVKDITVNKKVICHIFFQTPPWRWDSRRERARPWEERRGSD